MPKADAFFVPPERLDKDKIKKQSKKFLSFKYVEEILNALPNLVVVINKQRQVIFANTSFVGMLGIEKFEETLGQ